jgi:hypothetical protein
MSSLENNFDYQQLYFLTQIPTCICWTGGRVDPSFLWDFAKISILLLLDIVAVHLALNPLPTELPLAT